MNRFEAENWSTAFGYMAATEGPVLEMERTNTEIYSILADVKAAIVDVKVTASHIKKIGRQIRRYHP
jgi:hypothetical protein